MHYSKLDLFSSQFSFNVGSGQTKKGTLIETLLTFLVIITTLTYFVYIMRQYILNEIQPNFRSQNFITDDYVNITLSNDLVAFKYDYDVNSNSQYTLDQNKTFLVYLAYFYQKSGDESVIIQLDIINCTNKKLVGFFCLDLSKISNYTLSLNNHKNLISQIQIYTYGCLEIDFLKTFLPNNCANQSDIDKVINGINSGLKLKLLTSQYNTRTQEMQTYYRNVIVYTVGNQQIITQLKTQQSVTSVNKGPLIQEEHIFQSPIQYTQSDSTLDKQYATQEIGIGSYSTVIIYPDEIVQQIIIQYQTVPQILSFVSSIFTCLMFLGILGRKVSESSIQKDLFFSFLKIMFQDKYLQILKDNNLYKGQQNKIDNNLIQQQLILNNNNNNSNNIQRQEESDLIDESKDESNIIPKFINKKKLQLDQTLQHNKKERKEQHNKPKTSFKTFQSQQLGVLQAQKNTSIDFFKEKSNSTQEISLTKQDCQPNQYLNSSNISITKSQISQLKSSKNNFRDSSFLVPKQKQNIQSKFDQKNIETNIQQNLEQIQQQIQQQCQDNSIPKLLALQNSTLSSKIKNLIFRFTQFFSIFKINLTILFKAYAGKKKEFSKRQVLVINNFNKLTNKLIKIWISKLFYMT